LAESFALVSKDWSAGRSPRFFLAFEKTSAIQRTNDNTLSLMKNRAIALGAALLCLSLIPAFAQMGGRGGGMGGGPQSPQFGGSMAKLFGKNTAFTATVEIQMKIAAMEQGMTMPGKISVDTGKSRFEMDMSEAKGAGIPPEATAQMKAMGMDKMTIISRPDQKANYMVYPGLKAYAVMANQDPDAAKLEADFKLETTEAGKETVDGHACVKSKAVVTDDTGKKHEYTVWNATDLKNFPIKIESTEQGNNVTMSFKDVKFAKPEAAQFDPPADFKKYDNMMAMMQEEVMKRMGGGMGGPPPAR
jgi:hypothetical protein